MRKKVCITTSISTLAQRLKGASSHQIRSKNYPEVIKKLWGLHLWNSGYYVASCGGVSVEVLKKYVENQAAVYPPAKAGGFTAEER